ncbi:hypothetical protein D3C75_849240 [compost metagenome]
MLQEGMAGEADLAGQSCRVRPGFHTVEHITLVHQHMLHTVEAPEEIQVPVAAAEFAVGDCLQAQLLLLFHQLADFPVFYFRQCFPADDPGGELLSCCFQSGRAQEAADHVIAVRGGGS